MLDTFEIITTSGVVLWSRKYVDVAPQLINNLIKSAFIEETVRENTFRKNGHTIKWRTAKDLGIIFVVCFSNVHECVGSANATATNRQSISLSSRSHI